MFGLKSVVYVRSVGDVPTVEHWAIIDQDSYSTPESGVWAPGHGYPAETHQFVSYTAYTDKADFEAEIKDRNESKFSSHRSFRIIHVQPLTIKTTTIVEVA